MVLGVRDDKRRQSLKVSTQSNTFLSPKCKQSFHSVGVVNMIMMVVLRPRISLPCCTVVVSELLHELQDEVEDCVLAPGNRIMAPKLPWLRGQDVDIFLYRPSESQWWYATMLMQNSVHETYT